jgi:hypothetical protein
VFLAAPLAVGDADDKEVCDREHTQCPGVDSTSQGPCRCRNTGEPQHGTNAILDEVRDSSAGLHTADSGFGRGQFRALDTLVTAVDEEV